MSTKHAPKSRGTKNKASDVKVREREAVENGMTDPEPAVGEGPAECATNESAGPGDIKDPIPGIPAADVPEVPAAKRKRDMTIEELQAEYLEICGAPHMASYAERLDMRSCASGAG